jgi:hypothetical protein
VTEVVGVFVRFSCAASPTCPIAFLVGLKTVKYLFTLAIGISFAKSSNCEELHEPTKMLKNKENKSERSNPLLPPSFNIGVPNKSIQN